MTAENEQKFFAEETYEIELQPERFFVKGSEQGGPGLELKGVAEKINVLKVKRKTVAIVVVHGIMASRLVDANDPDKKIWDPDNNFFMLGFLKKGPDDRYEFIINRSRKVAGKNDAPYKVSSKGVEKRGWAGPSWSYYGKLIESLHKWDTELKHFIDLPVYAYAYDWVLSNSESAAGLIKFIQEKIQPAADKVIIVTHSMGGLVTRYALGASENSADVLPKILGVVHGAQPVHGAPTAYRRQLAGTEYASGFPFQWLIGFIASNVIGGGGPAISAIFPHAPGALELLPSNHYRNNKGQAAWLHVEDLDAPGTFHSFPQNNPYDEIYTVSSNDKYWGMLREEWLVPKDSVEIQEIKKTIIEASKFHEDLIINEKPYCHPRTFQIFSTGKHDTVTEVCWRAKDVTSAVKLQIKHYPDSRGAGFWPSFRDLELYRPAGTGEYRQFRWRRLGEEATSPLDLNMELSKIEKKLQAEPDLRIYEFWLTKYGKVEKGVQDPETCLLGDGTVPLSSATALRPAKSGWQGESASYLPEYEGIPCTGHVNKGEHAAFYDKHAIEAAKQAVHNLCLAWLRGEIVE